MNIIRILEENKAWSLDLTRIFKYILNLIPFLFWSSCRIIITFLTCYKLICFILSI